jgi:hypothetical protein
MHIPNRKDKSDLRTDAGDTGLKTADAITGAAVTTNLIVEITNGSDKKLFR